MSSGVEKRLEQDPFAARLFSGIRKNRQFTLIVFIVSLMHLFPFLYLRVSYPQDRLTPKFFSKIILWAPEKMPAIVQAQMNFIETFRDPSRLMLPGPYSISVSEDPPTSRLTKLEPSPARPVTLNAVLSRINKDPETLAVRANMAMNLKPVRFIRVAPIRETVWEPETRVVFASSIRDRVIGSSLKFPRVRAEILNQTMTTQIRIALDGHGLVRHAMVVISSGSVSIDNKALELVHRIQFTRLSEEESSKLTWGEVKFFWAFDTVEGEKEEADGR
jgi:hypothetical protein